MTHPENPSTEYILEKLETLKKTYKMNEEARLRNAGKTTLIIVGPSGTGKTTLTDEVIRLRPDIEPIATRTTRDRRREGVDKNPDPATFTTADEGFTHIKALEFAEQGEFVNFSNFGQHVYSTKPEDFPNFSIGPITADSVPYILNGGFDRSAVIFPVVEKHLFRHVLEEERLTFKDISYRLKEGIESTSFAADSVNEPWFHAVENSHEDGALQRSAENIIAIGEGGGTRLDPALAKQAILAMRDVLIDLKEAA